MLLCSDGGTASRLQHVMAAIDRFSPFNHLVGKSASPAGQPQLSQASSAQQPPSTRTPPSKPQRRPSSDSLRNGGKEDGWPDADRITELLNSMEDARFLLLLLERDSDNLEICSVVSNHMPKEKRPTSIVRMVSSGSEEVGGQALFPDLEAFVVPPPFEKKFLQLRPQPVCVMSSLMPLLPELISQLLEPTPDWSSTMINLLSHQERALQQLQLEQEDLFDHDTLEDRNGKELPHGNSPSRCLLKPSGSDKGYSAEASSSREFDSALQPASDLPGSPGSKDIEEREDVVRPSFC
ncbi:MAG: hypothetical protein SGPRY_008841 [Prymnesium sp.]